jgi:rubrerythrin
LAERLIRTAVNEAPTLLQEELPHLLRLAGPEGRDRLLEDLVAQAQTRDFDELKRLVFAAISANLADAKPLRASMERVFAEDATLHAVWHDTSSPHFERIAAELGALFAQAEKYRCNECGFAGRSFYWHCPACHAWDSFETCAVVRLR